MTKELKMYNINYKRRIKISDFGELEYTMRYKLMCDFYSCQIRHVENIFKHKPKNIEIKSFNPKIKEKNYSII